MAASGSEAAENAVGLFARDKRRQLILATRGGFHGKKGLAGAVTGSEQDAGRDPRVRFISFPKQECINLQRRSQPIDLAPYRRELERLASECGDRLACLITEPYLGGGGSFHPQPEYLQLLQEFCRQHDALLILDEIQSNFGRTGPMYAFTHYGLEPDIVCLGKGLGNGIPVSAAVGRADAFAALNYGEGSDTWAPIRWAMPRCWRRWMSSSRLMCSNGPSSCRRSFSRVVGSAVHRLDRPCPR